MPKGQQRVGSVQGDRVGQVEGTFGDLTWILNRSIEKQPGLLRCLLDWVATSTNRHQLEDQLESNRVWGIARASWSMRRLACRMGCGA